MRTLELAKVAAAAETLRLRRIVRRQALRAVFGAVAAVFALAALVVLHVVAWQALLLLVSPIQATLIVLAVDVAIAIALGVMAMRDVPDAVEQEAKQIRTQALIEMRSSLTMMAMAAEIAGVAMKVGAGSGMRRGVANTVAEAVSRFIGR